MGVFDQPSHDKIAEIGSRHKARDVSLLGTKARAFTPPDKALIRKVHGYMPAQQLLDVLNDRLGADLPDAPKYTIEQLYAEIGEVPSSAPAGGHDWSSLRKIVAKARRDGVLDTINRQVIDDFAVVFSLSTAQVLRLHDVLLRSKEDES